MRYTYAISSTRRKRAFLMGEIEHAERRIARLRDQPAAADATLRGTFSATFLMAVLAVLGITVLTLADLG
jgi:hypothetical protein